MDRMSFDLTSDRCKLKKILSGNFMQLEIKAISEGENRNRSSFTLDSMEKALPTFINKPILGYFNKDNDFESHNGRWKHDSETDMDYWDVNEEQGERILGLIRESDSITIEKDLSGKNWIVLTCALWTQYAFQQVKKLLKDKKKKVSVEIEIEDFEDVNGIRVIKSFQLLGITILGSRNGKPVLEGIEGASACVFDNLNSEVFSKQKAALCFAYQSLDGKSEGQKSYKEAEHKLEEVLTQDKSVEITEEAKVDHFEDEGCDGSCECNNECGEQCSCGDAPVETDAASEVSCNEDHDESDDDEHGDDEKDPEEQDDPSTDEQESCLTCADEEPKADTTEDCACTDHEECGKADNEAYETLLCEYNTLKSQYDELNEKLALYSDYEELKAQLTQANKELFEVACEKRTKEARQLMEDENIAKEREDQILENCASGKYASFDALKTDVALAIFESNNQHKAKKVEYSAALAPMSTAPEASHAGKSAYDKLRDYVKK